MKQYLDLVRDVLESGQPEINLARQDRTGVGTYSVFGRQVRFNLEDGFPLVTTKKIRSVFGMNGLIRKAIWDQFMGNSGAHGRVQMELRLIK
jgi:thymidylate synthase